MGTSADLTPHRGLDVWSDPGRERLATSANAVTAVRTLAAAVLAAVAVAQGSLTLLLVSLAVYWGGDILDGVVARVRGCETRVGAVLDIASDRFCAAVFYVGLAWLEPHLVLPVFLYLAEFMVVDTFLTLAFLAWPIRSPNYFFVVDRQIWRWNWSKPAKAVNSSLFAVVLLVTGTPWVGVLVALGLLVVKTASLVVLVGRGLPVPPGPDAASGAAAASR